MKKDSQSIIFIVPYFGKWPFWMPFFIQSCRLNPDINWLLISDCEPIDSLPHNVEQRKISFENYCKFVSERLGYDFLPSNAYKICDLRPAFGYVHKKDIEGYDFWAFGDLDVIYGDLRSYFTSEKLNKFKIFSTHERRVAGHLCLIRNEEKFINLFRKIPNFKKRLQDSKHHSLDEGAFTRLFLWRKSYPKPLFELIGLFNPLRRISDFTEAYSTPNASRRWIDGSMDFPASWMWEAGKLRNSKDGDREFPYLHFYGWKKKAWKTNVVDSTLSYEEVSSVNAWKVDEKGFHLIEKSLYEKF